MGSILIATDKDLEKLKGKFNPDAFQFGLISTDISIKEVTKKKDTNIFDLSPLIPPGEFMSNIVNNDISRFMENYLGFVTELRADVLAVLVVAAIEKDKDIVLVCSKMEYEDFLYLEALADIITSSFGIPVKSFKKSVKKGSIPRFKDDKSTKKALALAKEIVAYKKKSDKALGKNKDKKKGKKKSKK